MPRKRRPLFRRTKAGPIRLTDDDIAIIGYVADRSYARMSDLIRRLPHRSPKHLRGRVRKLYDHAYLDLPNAQQHDHVTFGKPEKIYALGDNGAALLAELNGVPASKSSWRDKNRSVKRLHIQHTLRIGDIKDAVERLPLAVPAAKVLSAPEILALAPPATARDPKPWLWQAHVRTKDGSLRRTKVIPDDVFAIDFTDRRKRYFFFTEADRGTEPVVRTKQHSSSVARKFETYLAGFKIGLHRSRYNIGNLRVIVVTTSQARIDTMLKALADIAGTADRNMFLFADFDQVTNAQHLMAVPWRNGSGAVVSLLD